MLQILNKTPFEAALALFTDQYGAEIVSIAIKGTFNIPGNKRTVLLADKQLPVLYTNEYFDTPGESSIKYPVDVVLEKINTDIMLIGNAHAPGRKPVKRLPVSLKVGQLQKTILVIGDRKWRKKLVMPGYSMDKPKPFTKLALRYEHAFGGVDNTPKNESKLDWDIRNPIGRGFKIRKKLIENSKLPNLEEPKHLISHWKDKPPVAGYGAIEGSWEPRLKFTGTCDSGWLENQFPLLPLDFKMRFFNLAHPDLIANGFLEGGQPVILTNLSKRGVLTFNLPKLEINLMFRLGENRNFQKANLWTVLFEPDENRFYMVWGGAFCVGKQPSQMSYVKVEMNGDTSAIDH